MAVYGGPDIVTDGLVLHLDAANRKSYPGSGTTWSDLSGNGNNGTLVNGVSYDSSNYGVMSFDGSNDYAEIIDNNLYKFSNTQPFSLSLWVNCIKTSGVAQLLTFALASGRGYYFTLDINSGRTNAFYFDYWDGSLFRGIQGNSNSISMNTWIMLTATSSSNSVTGMKVYQNGIITSYTNRGTSTPNTINYDTLTMRIGARGDSGYFNGDIANLSIYNRALSQQEIQKNYNATKERYGL